MHCESEKGPCRFAKKLKAKSIQRFVYIFCVLVHGNTSAQLWTCAALKSSASCLSFTPSPFHHIYTAFIQANKISALTFCTQIFYFTNAFLTCTRFNFLLIHLAILCAARGVCYVSPATLNSVQCCKCISINTSMRERHSYSYSTQPAGHL